MNIDDEAIRRALESLHDGRIERIRKVLDGLDAGSIAKGKALSLIEDIASGESDRIVKVGNTHTPEVQS